MLHLCVNTGFRDAILNGIRARRLKYGGIAFSGVRGSLFEVGVVAIRFLSYNASGKHIDFLRSSKCMTFDGEGCCFQWLIALPLYAVTIR